MKRPYIEYLLALVLPSALAVLAILVVARSEWREVHRTSDARAARILLAAFERELGQATDSVVAAGTATTAVDTTQTAVNRAMAGDTVTGIRPGNGAPEVFALTPPSAGDPPGSVRLAATPLDAGVPGRIGRATGYALSMYLNGRRWASTEVPAGPEALPGRGSPPPEGALAALGGGTAAEAAVVALARGLERVPGPVPVPLVLTIALLLLFATLSGWIQIAGKPRGDRPRRSRSMVLLALIPPLTAGAFMLQMDRAFEARAREVGAADLTRALAVASVFDLTGSAEAVGRLTGFDAALVDRGRIVASTVAGAAPALAAIPAPTAFITTTGRVVTPHGPSVYAALRTEAGPVLVTTTPAIGPEQARLRQRARSIAAALAAWLLAVGVVYATRGRRVSG